MQEAPILTPEHRETLLAALGRLADYRRIEHREYAPGIAEFRRRIRDRAWASSADRTFAKQARFYGDCAREALEAQPDDVLLVETLEVISEVPAHDDMDTVSNMGWDDWAQGFHLGLAHCANVAREALLACGLPAKPPTSDAARVAQRVADFEARAAAAHARLADTDGTA